MGLQLLHSETDTKAKTPSTLEDEIIVNNLFEISYYGTSLRIIKQDRKSNLPSNID